MPSKQPLPIACVEVELVVEMKVALEEGVALVDVIGRRDRAWSTALWTPIDLDILSDMFESFVRLGKRSSRDLSHVLAPSKY